MATTRKRGMGRAPNVVVCVGALAALGSGCLRDSNVCDFDEDCTSAFVCVQGDCVVRTSASDAGGEDTNEEPQDASGPLDVGGSLDAGADAADTSVTPPPNCTGQTGWLTDPADITLAPSGNVIVALSDISKEGVSVFTLPRPGSSSPCMRRHDIESNESVFVGGGRNQVTMVSSEDSVRVAFEGTREGQLVASTMGLGGEWGELEVIPPSNTQGVRHEYASLAFWRGGFATTALKLQDDANGRVEPVFMPAVGGTFDPLPVPSAPSDLQSVGTESVVLAGDLAQFWSIDGSTVVGRILDKMNTPSEPASVYQADSGVEFRGGMSAAAAFTGRTVHLAFLVSDGAQDVLEVVRVDLDTEQQEVNVLPRIDFPDGASSSNPSVVSVPGGFRVLYHERLEDSTSRLLMATWREGEWVSRVLDPVTNDSGLVRGVWEPESGRVVVVYLNAVEPAQFNGELKFMRVAPEL